jgi:DNA-binding transcriptional LysR family regulator
MDLRHLQYFLALAEDLDITKAAKHCKLTPSVFNRQISDLEENLGCSLFRRRGSQVSLSAAGQVFLERARELQASAADAMGEVKASAAAATSVVRLGHYGSWWEKRYKTALRQFRLKNPDVSIQASEYAPADLITGLREGLIDVAFLEHVDVGLRIDFNVKRIEVLPPVVLVNAENPLSKRKRVSFAELSEEVWVVWDERLFPGRRLMLLNLAQEAGCVPCISLEAENAQAVLEQVLNNGALGFAPDIGAPLPPGLVSIPLKSSSMEFPVFLAWRRDADNLIQLDSLAQCLLK